MSAGMHGRTYQEREAIHAAWVRGEVDDVVYAAFLERHVPHAKGGIRALYTRARTTAGREKS